MVCSSGFNGAGPYYARVIPVNIANTGQHVNKKLAEQAVLSLRTVCALAGAYLPSRPDAARAHHNSAAERIIGRPLKPEPAHKIFPVLRVIAHAPEKGTAVAGLTSEIQGLCRHGPPELNLLILAKAGAKQQVPLLPANISEAGRTTSQYLEITSFSLAPPPFCIAGDQFAVMYRDADGERSSPFIIDSALPLTALINAFDMLWLTARRASKADGPPGHLIPVINRLASGVTDLAAQRALNLSPRTFNRRSAEIMEILNARSRFQAGAEAARREWI